MARRYSGEWVDWAAVNSAKRARVSSRFGGLDHEIEREFFELSEADRHALLREYGRRYGSAAASYARKTLPRWKTREVLLSGQTAERLLDLVPRFLSRRRRFELIRQLRTYYLRGNRLTVDCYPAEWKERVVPAIRLLVSKSESTHLPPSVLATATWLTDSDSELAQVLLRQSEQEEASIRTKLLQAEFERLEQLIANIRRSALVSHVITLPQGTIHVTIRNPFSIWNSPILRWLRQLFGGT